MYVKVNIMEEFICSLDLIYSRSSSLDAIHHTIKGSSSLSINKKFLDIKNKSSLNNIGL
tara:strand:- start:964 stop:1140 length:177 start_codon:yes stop_codon:yes gene_type:complete